MYTSMFRKAMLGDTATLNLDFSAGTLPTAVTFTRADSTARATFIDASGYVQTVASAGDPRFDYTGGVAKGLLIEAGATNLCLQSQSLSTSWSQVNVNTPTVPTSPGVDDPFGGTSLTWKIVATATSGTHGVRHDFLTSAATATYSFFAKAAEYDRVILADPGTGVAACTFVLTGLGTATTVPNLITPTNATMVPLFGGWYRCSVTMPLITSPRFMIGGYPSTGATISGFGASYSGDNTSGVYATGMQLELGSSASSYVSTTTASRTRLADDAVIRSTAWTSLYAQPGAMVVEFYRGAYGAGDRSMMSTDPTAARHWHLKNANASATAQIAFSAGSPVTQVGLVSGLNKVAIAWSPPTPTASFDLCVNGASPTFGGSNVGTTLSTWLTLGSQSTTGVSGTGVWDGYLNNSIKSVKYYNALTYAEMQAKTT
jgi:hypothetical protein